MKKNDVLSAPHRTGAPPLFRKFLVSVAFGTTASASLGFLVDIIAVRDLGAGALEVGLLNTIETISYLVLALPAGVLLDRISKATAMVVAELGTALAVGSLCFGLATGTLSMPYLFAATFAFGLCSMLFGIASSSFVPSLVDSRSLEVAVARQRGIATSSGIIVPGVAGQMLTILAMPAMILFSAFCSAVSALLLWNVRGNVNTEDAPKTDSASAQGFLDSLLEGVRSSWSDAQFLILVLATALMNFGLAWSTSLQVPFYVRDLGLEPGVIGLIYSVSAAGALTGTLVAPRLIVRYGGLKMMKIATVCAVAVVILFPLSASVAWPVPMLLSHSSLYGATVALFNIALYGWVARTTPEDLLARRFSFLGFISMGVVPVGAITGGIFADRFGNEQSAWVWCLTSAASCGIATIGPMLRQRKVRTTMEIPKNHRTDLSIRTPTGEELRVLSRREPGGGAGIADSYHAAHLAGRVVYGVAWAGSVPCGTVVLDVSVETNRPELKHLFVYPDARRLGVGSTLISWAEAEAKNLGYDRIYIGVGEDNSAARLLYIALGYKTTGRIETTAYEYPGPDGNLIAATERDEIFSKDFLTVGTQVATAADDPTQTPDR